MSDPTNFTIWAGTGADISNLNLPSSSPVLVGYNLTGFLGSLGTLNSPSDTEYTQRFSDHARSAIAKYGIFTDLSHDTIGDGFTTLQLKTDYIRLDRKIGDRDTDLHYANSVINPAYNYNKFIELFTNSQKGNINLSQNNANNTLILSTASNLDIALGNGNNIVMTSPTMSIVYKNVNEDGKRHFWTSEWNEKDYTNIFYPSSQGANHSNKLRLGDGDNLVLFDGSYETIKSGNGNNIFAPSFGSFNWATNDAHDYANPVAPSGRTLLSPIPLSAIAKNKLYSENDLYTLVLNQHKEAVVARVVTKETGFQVYLGKDPSLTNNKDNTIGGLRIIAGHGDDTFYGQDPNFYDTIPATHDDLSKIRPGADRVVFDQPTDTKNQRLSLQNYETIEMLAGGGNNIFYLGNPTHLSADGSQYTGRFSYKISAAHEKFGSDEDRADLMWGEGSSAVSSININLSANVETYKLSSSSFEQDKGKDAPVLDTIKMGTSIANSTNKFFDKIMEKGKVWKFIPYADFALSAVSAVVDSVKAIKGWFGVAPDPEPIQLSETQFKQPLGSWKQAIYVDDWHPNLVLNISVDPTTTTSKDLRWGNIVFKLNPPDSSSESLDGITISQQQGSDIARDLFRLNGLGSSKSGSSPDFGYYSYDFRKGEYRVITEKDLSFFGHIANDVNGINPISNYAAKNGFVFSSTNSNVASAYGDTAYTFYWNDPGRNPVTGDDHTEKWLQDARNSASQLSIQFDSRQMGWFWDPHFAPDPAEGPNAITIDKAKSLLWIEQAIGKWAAFTWLDLEKQPLAYSYALKAKTFYQVNENGETKVDRDQITTKKIIESLVQLDKSVPNLDNLGRRDLESKTYLSSVDQITFVNDGPYTPPASGFNPNPKTYQGQWIYYLYDDADPTTSDVFKAFVYYDDLPGRVQLGQTYNANFKKVLSFSEVYETEKSNKVDINLDGMIGAPPLKALLSSQGIAGPATPDAPAPNEIKTTSDLVSNFYLACLNRDPDEGGLRAWVNAIDSQALTKADTLASIVGSEEFLAQQGSAAEFVARLYEIFLMRDPNSEELDTWRDAIDDGMALSNVVNGFATSSEFKALVGIANQG